MNQTLAKSQFWNHPLPLLHRSWADEELQRLQQQQLQRQSGRRAVAVAQVIEVVGAVMVQRLIVGAVRVSVGAVRVAVHAVLCVDTVQIQWWQKRVEAEGRWWPQQTVVVAEWLGIQQSKQQANAHRLQHISP